MGHKEAATLLQEALNEEKAADEKLTAIAEGGVNQEAADAAHPDDVSRSLAVGSGGGPRLRPLRPTSVPRRDGPEVFT